MSGWQAASGHYEVLASKMLRWHRRCWLGPAGVCWCWSKSGKFEDALVAHLRASGFKVDYSSGHALILGGPGIAERSTGPLYEAVSGRPASPSREEWFPPS